jgi:hypothetical protein
MSENILSRKDAESQLHRFITKKIPIVGWFVSRNNSVQARISGFVDSLSDRVGLVISTESVRINPASRMPTYMIFSHALISASEFRHFDEAEVPEGLHLGAGLRIDFPDGDSLSILEKRDK